MKILDIITETAPIVLTQQQIETLAQSWIKANAKEAEALAQSSLTKYDAGSLQIFKIIGITALVGILNVNLYALEQIAKQDLETFRASNPAFANYTQEQKNAYIDNARDQYYGIIATQILIKPIIIWVRNKTPMLNKLVDVIEKGLGTKGKIIGHAAILALQASLSTEYVQGLLGQSLMNLIRFGGKGVAGSWDWLAGHIEDKLHVPISQINPATGAAVAANGAAQAGPPLASYADLEKAKADIQKDFKPMIAPTGSLN
jgi:hypothetical protein